MVGRKAAAAARCAWCRSCAWASAEHGNDAVEYVQAQVHGALGAVPEAAEVVIAYEPVWAIGGRAIAERDRISAVVDALREATGARSGRVRILYGGSVAPGQARGLRATGVTACSSGGARS